jgi:hypothetical protein
VTVTVAGLPEAPLAVTWIVPERCALAFVEYETLIVPLFPPVAPDAIDSHDEPLATVAE